MKNNDDIKVDVILASYNSNGYIREQLNSILAQTYKNIRILVRDDGSQDDTVKIVNEIAKYDDRVVLIEDNILPNGVGENFKTLLTYCNSEYVLLSDQDDVWLQDKIETLVNYSSQNFDNNIPSIAYAPGLVVDSNLNGKGLLTNYHNKATSFNDILLMNGGIQGCAMLINKALYKKAIEKDFFWYMHDQVLTMFALVFGRTYFIDKPLFLYRQHSFNVLGYNSSTRMLKAKKYILTKSDTFLINRHSLNLFNDFIKFYGPEMSGKDYKTLVSFCKLEDRNLLLRCYYIIRHNIRLKHSLFKSLLKSLVVRKFVETNHNKCE